MLCIIVVMDLIDKCSNYKILYEKYLNQMYSYGMAFGLEEDILYDFIHDVFLHLFEHQNELGDQKYAKYYLFKCLKNRILLYKRQEVNMEFVEDINDIPFAVVTSGLDIIEEKEEQKELTRQIDGMMRCLTNRQREAVYLRFMQELEYDEIAIILQLTPKGTRKLVYRAIDRIREQYGITFTYLFLYHHFFLF